MGLVLGSWGLFQLLFIVHRFPRRGRGTQSFPTPEKFGTQFQGVEGYAGALQGCGLRIYCDDLRFRVGVRAGDFV